MEAEILASVTQVNCKHERHRKYTERNFDILNGFEIIASKCSNCHKTLELTINKLICL
jgi:formate-dependent nitrite reductase cytochrome c552 subunit